MTYQSDSQQNVLSNDPYNSEPRPADLISTRLTDTKSLYHRNHGPLLHLDRAAYKLKLIPEALPHLPSLGLGLDDVQQNFVATELEGMLMCAGNRRNEMDHVKQVEGLKWDRSAIANAKWQGALLRQVLTEWGFKSDQSTAGLHCHFESDQKCEEDSYFGASIPLSMAMDPEVPVLLAYKMNGQDLPVEHGGPLRVYIPGVIGARSVKFLHRIIIRDHESTCFYQQKDYKILPPQATAETKEKYMQETPAMLEYGLNTAICSPQPDETITTSTSAPHAGKLEVSGYAYGAKGAPLKAVYVTALARTSSQSLEDLYTRAQGLPHSAWTAAELETGEPVRGSTRNYAWTLWRAYVAVPAPSESGPEHQPEEERERRKVALVAWCEDIKGEKQPVQVDWNIRGIGEASWSVVKVTVK